MISVLLCTYNRGSLIDGTLQSIIEAQELLPDEIIVINGGGENDCAAIVEGWQIKFPALKHIRTENQNLATSRNIGLRHCNGNIVVQTDDDARPFPNWLKSMKAAHEQYQDAGVIGGEVVDASGKGLLYTVADALTFPWYPTVKEVRNVPGVNSSYKKKLLEQLGDYDTNLFRGEDVDYNWRALQMGWKVLYVPGIKVYHHHRAAWKGLFHQHYMYGRAYYLVRSKWPEMYSVYPRTVQTFKGVLKAVYFPLSPVHNAFLRVKRVNGFFNRLAAFVPLLVVGYFWMAGLLVQRFVKRKHPIHQSIKIAPAE
jgi:glycosyltransferase involved in cell wall biosynthesis